MTHAEQQDLLSTLNDLTDEAVRRIIETSPPEQQDLAVRFERFHAANPHVYEHLVRLAREAKAAGHERIGIAMLFEVLRYEVLIGRDPREDFKLNNDYRAFYAREIMRREVDLENVFETRAGRWND